MNLLYVLDENGNPVPEPDVHRIRAGCEGPPILWETMVFGGEFTDECRRYSSQEDARRGHAEMVKKVKGEEDE